MHYKQYADCVTMMKWVIRKMFEKYDGITLNVNDLKWAIQKAWNEMLEDEEIYIDDKG